MATRSKFIRKDGQYTVLGKIQFKSMHPRHRRTPKNTLLVGEPYKIVWSQKLQGLVNGKDFYTYFIDMKQDHLVYLRPR